MREYMHVGEGRMAAAIMGWLAEGSAAPVPISSRRRCDLFRIADAGRPWFNWPLPNAWLGVSAEDQATADERIPILLETPAAVRWLSAEPLLGPMEIDASLAGLDWVVAGGESGPRARPMEAAWARSLRNQCLCSDTAFFFKQWGGATSKAGGAVLDGREWRQFPDAA